jgi:hypothetical protein
MVWCYLAVSRASALKMVAPMNSWRWRIFVLVASARVLNGQRQDSSRTIVPPSPCPNLFYYYTDSQTSQIRGALHIPPTDSDKIIIYADFIVSVYFKTVRGNKYFFSHWTNMLKNLAFYFY